MRNTHPVGAFKALLFTVVMVLPMMALLRAAQTFGHWQLCAYLVLVSLLTIGLYRSDKRRAQTGAWRIQESQLHLLELAGGWAAAFWAQQFLRHKTRKTSFQIVFWAIILLHQCLAYDYLQDWHYSRKWFS